jgi:FkbM family methyltransferase
MRRPRYPGNVYKPGQAGEHFFPYLLRKPEWFIDLGPANATEYLDARSLFPEVKLIGLEPSPVGYQRALERWPKDGSYLLNTAAWDSDTRIRLYKASDLRHGTAYADADKVAVEDLNGESADAVEVEARTLDSLDLQYGPFREAALWMDVEGSERRVLKGAKRLLEDGVITSVNIETRPHLAEEFDRVLRGYGFTSIRRYLECETYWDEVWVR